MNGIEFCKRIIIASPANAQTGGPELMHQLCYVLREKGYNAFMYYYGGDKKTECPKAYLSYANPFFTEFEEQNTDLLIVPETATYLVKNFKLLRVWCWWLSVDNFYVSEEKKIWKFLGMSKEYQYKFRNKVALSSVSKMLRERYELHLAQSYYAVDSCLNMGIPNGHIKFLSDYINSEFIDRAQTAKVKKENIILYNPKKGMNFTKKIIDFMPDWKWIPLAGFTRSQMSEMLLKAKVYIDFGEHPGKDRIPREAAISNCCVITGKRGSAGFYNDVPINPEYKFDDTDTEINNIIKKIKDVFDNYENCLQDFVGYRSFIRLEKKKFYNDVNEIFKY